MSGSFSRAWCMPNHETFSIAPVRDLLRRHLSAGMVIVDPFARDSDIATITNDLDIGTKAQHHMYADAFLRMLHEERGVRADAVLFDPPYSPRQMAEVYRKVGLAGREVSQTAKLYKEVRDGLDALLKPGGVAISFGWNSSGFGAGYERVETLLVCHGAAHNDTICVVERKPT